MRAANERIVLFALLCLFLAGCTSVPKTLAPVPATLPTDAADYPPDAVYASLGVIARIQGMTIRGIRFDEGAARYLDEHGYDYPGFSLEGHKLMQYHPRDDGKAGRYANGLVRMQDAFGRRTGIIYSVLYALDDKGMRIDAATASPVYPQSPTIRMLLVPKGKLPDIGETWEQTYTSMQALDEMPKGGLKDARTLNTHVLCIFVMDRTPQESDISLNLDIPGLENLPPQLALTPEDYLNFDGWRVAFVSLEPGEFARATPATPTATPRS